MGNSDGERNFEESSSTSAPEVGGSLSKLRRILLAPEQDQLDRLERRLDTNKEQFVRLEQQLDQEKGKINEIEEKFEIHQEALRTLVQRFGADKDQLAVLEQKLDNKIPTSEEISQVLPQAIHLRPNPDSELAEALAPLISEGFSKSVEESPAKIVNAISPRLGEIIKQSIEKDPDMIVKTIAPIIGSTIREAINQALEKMLQNLNQKSLEYGFSLQGLKLRFEAYKKGIPFPQYLILRMHALKVEQVFLIHKDTGILLYHMFRETGPRLDKHSIAGMLAAIQAFVSDSFIGGGKENLSFCKIGDYKVFVEQGPEAYLAVVGTGLSIDDLGFREALKTILDRIHINLRESFLGFKGDTSSFGHVGESLKNVLDPENIKNDLRATIENDPSFETTRVLLMELTQNEDMKGKAEVNPEKKLLGFKWAWITLIVLFILGMFFLYNKSSTVGSERWASFIQRVEDEPGVLGVSVAEGGEKNIVRVIRDSLSASGEDSLRTIANQENLEVTFSHYLVLSTEDINNIANVFLEPPDSVVLSIKGDVLFASGSAPHQWVTRFQRTAKLLPGIRQVNNQQLEDKELYEFNNLKGRIENQQIQFAQGSAKISLNMRAKLAFLSEDIKKIDGVVQRLGGTSLIEVRGHTSPEGSANRNTELALARARSSLSMLDAKDLKVTQLVPIGINAEKTLPVEVQDKDHSQDRRVSFHVVLAE